jgi:hypothetical protein
MLSGKAGRYAAASLWKSRRRSKRTEEKHHKRYSEAMGNRHRSDLGAVPFGEHRHRHGASRNGSEESRFRMDTRGTSQRERAENADQKNGHGRGCDGRPIAGQSGDHRRRKIKRNRRTQYHLTHLTGVRGECICTPIRFREATPTIGPTIHGIGV